MARLDRFQKLETERRLTEGKSSPSLERFSGEAPQASPPTEERAASLERFSGDAAPLRLDDDPLALLPDLECPTCQVTTGKFQVFCHACGTRLDTAEARAHNLPRVEVLQAQQAQDAERAAQRRAAELAQATELRGQQREVMVRQLRHVRDETERRLERGSRWRWRHGRWLLLPLFLWAWWPDQLPSWPRYVALALGVLGGLLMLRRITGRPGLSDWLRKRQTDEDDNRPPSERSGT